MIFANEDLYNKFEVQNSPDIIEWIRLDEKVLAKIRTNKSNFNTLLDNASETHNTNIAIASAITAYARIHMSYFKNNPNFNLYYTDTDSAYIDAQLPDHMVSYKELGLMKLENVLTKAIFIAPKVYYLETIDGNVIYKVKGLSHDVVLTKDDFEHLLVKDSFIRKFQTKWIKNISKGHVSIINGVYTLKVTDNKRSLIYFNNKLTSTRPYIINNNEII